MRFPDAALARRLERERDHGQVLYAPRGARKPDAQGLAPAAQRTRSLSLPAPKWAPRQPT